MTPMHFTATGLSAALPHVGLTYIDLDRIVRDIVNGDVRMEPAAEGRSQPFFLN